jgi:hypothetical protein
MSEPDASPLSAWYAAMGETPDQDRIWTHALGLPDHVLSTSARTGPALDEVAGPLALRPDDVLLDLACGRAGYGRAGGVRGGRRSPRVPGPRSARPAVGGATCARGGRRPLPRARDRSPGRLTWLRNPAAGTPARPGISARGADVAHVSSKSRPDGGKPLTGTRTSTYRRDMQRLEVLLLIPGRGEVR